MKQLTHAALWVAFLASLWACTTRDDEAAYLVELSTDNYTFQAPDTINAGLTTFHFANLDDENHYAHSVKLDSGRTVFELVEVYGDAIRNARPRMTWVTRFGGPGATAPGDSSSVTQHMEPGHYAWICPVEDRDGTPHFSKGEVKSFVVNNTNLKAEGQKTPEASNIIRLMDYTFALETHLNSGEYTIRVVNDGSDPHDVELARLAPGKNVEDVKNWLQNGQGEPPVTNLAGGVAVIAPGMEAYFEVELTAGEYVLICFATDDDGRTHIEHGMIQKVSVK